VLGQVVDAVDTGRVRRGHDHDERVPREDHRLRAELVVVELLRKGCVRRGEDVGRAVAAIASGSLPFSTGEVINVDGGFHLRRL
jgi:hypothetical protein